MIITKFTLSEIAEYFLPYAGTTYKLTLTSKGIPDYWSDWGVDDTYSTENKDIISVSYVIRATVYNYSQKTSLADCLVDNESFFYNFATQTLYVNFSVNPDAIVVNIGDITGYSDDYTVYIDDQEYAPYLRTIPSISKSVDPLISSKMSFQNQNIVLENGTGEQDRFIADPIPGIKIEIDHYDEDTTNLTSIYTGYVTSDSYGIDTAEFVIADNRQKDNITVPTHLFSVADYPDLDDKYKGKVIPQVYGSVLGAKCVPLNGTDDSATLYSFRPCEFISTLSTVYVKGDDDRWGIVSTASEDLGNGTFVLNSTDCVNASGKLQQVKADLTGIALTNPADIIADLNNRYGDIVYDSSNYNTIEWVAEKALIGGSCYLMMDKALPVFEYFEMLQNAGLRQFVYDITADGKRTLRVYDPNRTESFDVDNWQLIEQDSERDFNFYASTVTVECEHDFTDDYSTIIVDDTYKIERIIKYGHENDYIVPVTKAGFDTDNDALIKAANIAEKYKPEMVYTVTIFNDDPGMFNDLRLFSTGYIDFVNDDVGIDGNSRTFLGRIRCIVEDISFDLAQNTVTIKARHREIV